MRHQGFGELLHQPRAAHQSHDAEVEGELHQDAGGAGHGLVHRPQETREAAMQHHRQPQQQQVDPVRGDEGKALAAEMGQ